MRVQDNDTDPAGEAPTELPLGLDAEGQPSFDASYEAEWQAEVPLNAALDAVPTVAPGDDAAHKRKMRRFAIVTIVLIAVALVPFYFYAGKQYELKSAAEQEYATRTYDRPAFASDLPTGEASFEASRAAWTGDEQGYWHARLQGRQRYLYDVLLPHVQACDTDFVVGSEDELFSAEEIEKLYGTQEVADEVYKVFWGDLWSAEWAIRCDHPELYWYYGGRNDFSTVSMSCDWEQDDAGTWNLLLTGYDVYGYTDEDRAELQPQIDAAIEEALAAVPEGASDYEQAAAVYQWLAENVQYDEATKERQSALREGEDAPRVDSMRDGGQTIVSALVERNTVCAGYSRAYQLILSRLGIPCTYVIGYWDELGVAHEECSHAWNLVCLAGTYGYTDVTASDMAEDFVYDGFYSTMEFSGVWWMYFFMTDSEMAFDGREAAMSEATLPDDYPVCDTVIWEDDRFEVHEDAEYDDVGYDAMGNPLVSWWRVNYHKGKTRRIG